MATGISLVSTYAKDVLVEKNGKVLSEQKGGPLLFLEEVIKLQNIPYNSIAGAEVIVEIQIVDGIERSKIRNIKNQNIPSDKLYDWTLISTLLREWKLTSLKKYSGQIYIDIQGYVRDGSRYGGKKLWTELEDENLDVKCLKGTIEEVTYLPKNILEAQKNKLLIITDGAKDITIFSEGRELKISPKPIINPKNTIGAGDTFFTNTVCNLYKGLVIKDAVHEAALATSEFLLNK